MTTLGFSTQILSGVGNGSHACQHPGKPYFKYRIMHAAASILNMKVNLGKEIYREQKIQVSVYGHVKESLVVVKTPRSH